MTVGAPVPTAPAPSRTPGGWQWAAAVGWLALALLTVPAASTAADADHHASAGHDGSTLIGRHAAAWPAMVATMAPLIAPNVRYAAMRSPTRARRQIAATVVAGWTLVWLVAGAGLAVGMGAVDGLAGGPLTLVGATIGAVVWQGTRVKRRSVARCSRRLAPPLDREEGRRAAWRHGMVLGRDCVLSCWPLMGLTTAARHSMPVAAVCVGVAWYERRRRPHHDPPTGATSLLIAAAGAGALLVGVPPVS